MADEKAQRERFRALQHGQPHPALQQHPGEHGEEDWLDCEPDTGRVILHFDVDCFYAQV